MDRGCIPEGIRGPSGLVLNRTEQQQTRSAAWQIETSKYGLSAPNDVNGRRFDGAHLWASTQTFSMRQHSSERAAIRLHFRTSDLRIAI